MKRILVPVDGSETALRGLRLAAQRARESGAEIHVLHVEPHMHYEELRVYAVRPDMEQVRRDACQRVLKTAADALAAENLPHVEHLRQGEIAHVIADFVRSQAMDEVIMGTRGVAALGNVLLGSVAYRVVHLVDVPVTLVK